MFRSVAPILIFLVFAVSLNIAEAGRRSKCQEHCRRCDSCCKDKRSLRFDENNEHGQRLYCESYDRELAPLPFTTWPESRDGYRTIQQVTYLEENIIITVDKWSGSGDPYIPYPDQIKLYKLTSAVVEGEPWEPLLTLNLTDLEQVHAMTRPGKAYLYLLCIRNTNQSLLYTINEDFNVIRQDSLLPGYNAALFKDRYLDMEAMVLMLYSYDDVPTITVYAWTSQNDTFEIVTYRNSTQEIIKWFRTNNVVYIVTADLYDGGLAILRWNSSHLVECEIPSSEFNRMELTQRASETLDITEHGGNVFLALSQRLPADKHQIKIYKLLARGNSVTVHELQEIHHESLQKAPARASSCKFVHFDQNLSLLIGVHINNTLMYKYNNKHEHGKFRHTVTTTLGMKSMTGAALSEVSGDSVLLLARSDFSYSSEPSNIGANSATYVLSADDP